VDLRGKTVLVTGAAGTGVGAGVCQAVVAAGGRLVVNDLTAEGTEAARHAHGAVAGFAADVSSEAEVEAMFAGIAAAVGRLDGVVNNAGVGLDRGVVDTTADDYRRIESTDLRGTWLVSRAFARQAVAGGGGSIVNVSSVHAVATMRGYALYAAAKAGVEGFTRGLAAELGSFGVRCNAIAPGYVHSAQNEALITGWTDDPAGWVRAHVQEQQALPVEVEPLDCGWAAVFFLSDASRAVTGQVLRVDAGLTTLLYDKAFK
jgi:NAD(P)-dependent dehydrogenase (short-subunit alcohol dehydrogenase family)